MCLICDRIEMIKNKDLINDPKEIYEIIAK